MKAGWPASSSIWLRSQWTWTSTVRVSPRVVVAPDVLEQLVAGEDLARVADQEREQLEGLGLDRQHLAVAQQPVAAEVGLDGGRGRSTAGGPSIATPAPTGGTWPGSGPESSRRLNGLVT